MFVIFLVLLGPWIIESTDYLYNLDDDPYEDTNLAESSTYSSILTYFTSKHEYWLDYLATNDAPDSSLCESTWDSLGGIGPWLESDFNPRNITQKYTYEDAPNIVFVLIDDWGYNDAGFRSTYLNWTTPTFDRLLSEGVLLENYNTYHICSPSRAAFLTGRFSLRLGIQALGPELPLEEVTLAEELKSAGYRTYLIGKWHLVSLIPRFIRLN